MSEANTTATEEQTGRYQFGYHIMSCGVMIPEGYQRDEDMLSLVRSVKPTHIHDHQTGKLVPIDKDMIYLTGAIKSQGPRFKELPDNIKIE